MAKKSGKASAPAEKRKKSPQARGARAAVGKTAATDPEAGGGDVAAPAAAEGVPARERGPAAASGSAREAATRGASCRWPVGRLRPPRRGVGDRGPTGVAFRLEAAGRRSGRPGPLR